MSTQPSDSVDPSTMRSNVAVDGRHKNKSRVTPRDGRRGKSSSPTGDAGPTCMQRAYKLLVLDVLDEAEPNAERARKLTLVAFFPWWLLGTPLIVGWYGAHQARHHDAALFAIVAAWALAAVYVVFLYIFVRNAKRAPPLPFHALFFLCYVLFAAAALTIPVAPAGLLCALCAIVAQLCGLSMLPHVLCTAAVVMVEAYNRVVIPGAILDSNDEPFVPCNATVPPAVVTGDSVWVGNLLGRATMQLFFGAVPCVLVMLTVVSVVDSYARCVASADRTVALTTHLADRMRSFDVSGVRQMLAQYAEDESHDPAVLDNLVELADALAQFKEGQSVPKQADVVEAQPASPGRRWSMSFDEMPAHLVTSPRIFDSSRPAAYLPMPAVERRASVQRGDEASHESARSMPHEPPANGDE